MQLTLHIPSSNHFCDAIYGTLGQRNAKKNNTYPPKTPGFQLLSAKTCRQKIFVHRKHQIPSKKTLPLQLSLKRTHPNFAFVVTALQIRETQWGISNLLRKIKEFRFFDGNWPKKFFGTIYHTKLLK